MQRTPKRLIAACATFGLLLTSCAAVDSLPKLTAKDLAFHPAQSSKILAGNGHVITTLHGIQNRTVIPISEIPKDVQHAVIAIEDQRFYQHSGVDFHAVMRALAADISNGQAVEGGSTITQQYVKNVIIAPGRIAPKTASRKIDEAVLARQIEQRLSKKEILERYLNTVYFGEGAYGVEAASQTYFGIDASKLSLPQAALIAGTIQAPTSFDPKLHPKAAKFRRNIVIRKMRQQGYIGWHKAKHALRSGIKLTHKEEKSTYPAPYFVDYVTRLIKFDPRFKALGPTWEAREKRLYTGGLKIYTTVNLHDQKLAEQSINSILTYPSDPYGSLVSIDPKTGEIKAMVGGRNYFAKPKQDRFSKLNLATVAEPDLSAGGEPAPGSGRQAGSSFKPFALAAAIKQGVPLSKEYKAAPCMDFPGADASGVWHVCNYEGESFPSQITLLEATALSVNVVFAQLILQIGPEAVVTTAQDMGIRTDLQAVNSAVLGTNPVNPLDMASAYGTFATNGVHHPPIAIRRIVGPDGKTIYRDDSKPVQALDPTTAYLATTALEGVVQHGTGVNASIGRPQAGKTGTAQEWRDAWFVGYTPDIVTSVWVGYPEGEIEMKTSCSRSYTPCRQTRITVQGGSWPAEIWAKYDLQALSGVPATPFKQPSVGITTVTIDSRTGCLADQYTPPVYRTTGTFAAGSAPTQTCRQPGDIVTVPNVYGFPQEQAVKVLQKNGFAVSVQTQKTDVYPPGRVIDETPGGNSKAARGSTVTIVVSLAKKVKTSPSPTPSPTKSNNGNGGDHKPGHHHKKHHKP